MTDETKSRWDKCERTYCGHPRLDHLSIIPPYICIAENCTCKCKEFVALATVEKLAYAIYERRVKNHVPGNSHTDWQEALKEIA